MTDIVITEFMDDTAVANLKARFAVHYDPELYANPDEVISVIKPKGEKT